MKEHITKSLPSANGEEDELGRVPALPQRAGAADDEPSIQRLRQRLDEADRNRCDDLLWWMAVGGTLNKPRERV